MKYITLANLRSGAGRLVAAGIAVMISVAFIAAVMSLADAWNQTMRAQAEGSAAGADLIVSPDLDARDYHDITPAAAKKLDDDAHSLPAISGTQPVAEKYADATIGGQEAYFTAQAAPLGRNLDIAEGNAPAGKRQVVVYQDVAKSMGLSVGQHIRVQMENFDESDDSTGDDSTGDQNNAPKPVSLTVSGIARGSDGGQPALYATAAGYAALPGGESINGVRIVLARVIVPPLVTGVGRLLEKATHGGPVPGLVGRNVRLVPRRTASTASALLIGVTLVTTMMVGAQTVKTTSESALVESNAVDLSVLQPDRKTDKVLKDSDIVTTTGRLDGARVTVPQATQDGEKFTATVLAATAAGVAPARGSHMIPPRGTVWANSNEYPTDDDSTDGSAGDTGDNSGDPKPKPATAILQGKHGSVKVAVAFGPGVPAGTLLANPDDIAPLHPTAAQGAVWAKVADTASSADVQKLATALGDSDNVDLEGAAMRADTSTIINIVLAIVLALLAASLVVAVVGVANTLSLSVMERKRETALLRAMGMTRGQVASMVTLEAVLIAVVAVVIGLGLGVFFSWAGISSLLEGEDFAVVVGLPWLQLAAVVVAAVLAALLASVIPARAVNRTKPAQGLSA